MKSQYNALKEMKIHILKFCVIFRSILLPGIYC